GEIKSSDNLLNNQSLKEAGFDLKPVGKSAPTGINDKIVKGIDGLYENANPNSNIKYVIDEAKFGSSQLGKTKDGPQMSDGWLTGVNTEKSRILKAVDGDNKLADKITKALERDKVERVLSKVDSSGKVKTFKIDAKGNIVGEWP
ncbi:TPA: cytoplasmic protein, partial [Bacillus cereus]|nr:cytoplasmic protein [Bacillus cereus]